MAITFSSVMLGFRRFLRIIMVILNILGALSGLAILVAGAWALSGERSVIVIAPSQTEKFTGVPILMVVLGVFLIILGGVGVVGSIFNKTKWGRVLLITYAIVLAILVLIEIIGGIVAAVRKDDVASIFETSASATFMDYKINMVVWDNFQRAFECCALKNFTEFRMELNISVPVSCCNTVNIRPESCAAALQIGPNYINTWNIGCVDAVKNSLANYLAAVAAVAIIFALVQIVVVAVSIFVAAERSPVKYDTMSPGADKNAIGDEAAESS